MPLAFSTCNNALSLCTKTSLKRKQISMVARRLTRTSRSEVSDFGGVPAISSSQLFRPEKISVSDLGYSQTSPFRSEVSNSGVVSAITAAPTWMNDREARRACFVGMIGDWRWDLNKVGYFKVNIGDYYCEYRFSLYLLDSSFRRNNKLELNKVLLGYVPWFEFGINGGEEVNERRYIRRPHLR